MLLSNLISVTDNISIDILLESGKIASVTKSESPPTNASVGSISFHNAIIFPGLINSHDHLDFNLFPRLGIHVYSNYMEWGKDIHTTNKTVINKVLKIPKTLRTQWGIYKNLLNGITTVVNHGEHLNTDTDLINVIQDTQALHSVGFEKKWKLKLNNPFSKNKLVNIHVGEGVDNISHEEINQLLKWNLLKRNLIGIHGVAMDAKQANSFKALIWCPDSNMFLLNKTANIEQLKQHTKILFGTDSTLSASWNLFDHLQLARSMHMASDSEIFNMLTIIAADIFALHNTGSIKQGYIPDLVIAKNKNNLPAMDAFFNIHPEDILLVIHNGDIKLFDEELFQKLSTSGLNMVEFTKVSLKAQSKYLKGNITALVTAIKNYYPEADIPITI